MTTFAPSGASQAVDADGSILLASGKTLTLYTPGGALDTAFGTGGYVTLPDELEGLPLSLRSYAFDHQSRILLFGLLTDPKQEYVDPYLLRSIQAAWAVVIRLRPTGEIDPSFGQGKGFVRSDFGLRTKVIPRAGVQEPLFPTTRAGMGLVDSQDRPVFIAEVLEPTGRCDYGKGFVSEYPKAVVRLSADGALDPTFGGGDGIAEVSGAERGASLQLDAVDGLFVATNSEDCGRGDNVFRLRTDGQPAPDFGVSGVRRYPGFVFLANGPGGKLTLGGTVRERKRSMPAVLRANSSGQLDPSFGNRGKAAVALPTGAERWWTIAGVDSSGRTVLVGTFDLPKPGKARDPKRQRPPNARKSRQERSYLFVKRLLSNGKVDRGFGNEGKVVTRFKRPRYLSVSAAELDDQGRLVVLVGSVSARQLPGARLTLVRYSLKG